MKVYYLDKKSNVDAVKDKKLVKGSKEESNMIQDFACNLSDLPQL